MKRANYIDVEKKKVLMARIAGSIQESDLSEKPNCDGFGRIRHFKRHVDNWVDDTLPIDPASKALGLSNNLPDMNTQVFQNAFCNMNCWYCFVPDELKNASKGAWLSASDLIEKLMKEKNQSKVIDISGGNPELIPEFIKWIMEELVKKGLQDNFYLWSDDTLSTDLMKENLSQKDIDYMASYPNYGKVCCFKGFDKQSYTFNSGRNSNNYDNQFRRLKAYIKAGFDTYGYITLTTDNMIDITKKVETFIDRLQKDVHENFPLRIVPLKIFNFTPTNDRIQALHSQSFKYQRIVLDIWQETLNKKFNTLQLNQNISDVDVRGN